MRIDTKKIIYIMIVITMLLINIIPNISLATTGKPELKVEVSKESLDPGEEFTVSVNFNNNGATNCTGFDFGLKYDTEILEVISSSTAVSTGTAVLNDKNVGNVNFVLVSIQGLQYSGELFTVTFRVKQNAGGGESTLRIASDHSDYPIEDETGIPTTIIEGKINVNNATKQNTSEPNRQTQTSNDEYIETSEKIEEETDEKNQANATKDTENTVDEKNEDTIETSSKDSQGKEINGLPKITIIILLIISLLGILTIYLLLRKKKK